MAKYIGLRSVWIAMDLSVNGWCIVLMYAVHKKIYNKLCVKCSNNCVKQSCIACFACNCCCPIIKQITKDVNIKVNQTNSQP